MTDDSAKNSSIPNAHLSMVCNFEEDLKTIIAHIFSLSGITINAAEETLEDLVRKHVNFQNRLIDSHPRTVHRSRELKTKQLTAEINAALDDIERKFQFGKNINPHLSTLIIDPSYHDALFYDWKIQHLHLGLSSGRQARYPNFVNRAADLLYIFVTGTEAYFIDVLDHDPVSGFANKVLLEIINANWSHLITSYQPNGARGVSHTFTNEQTSELRRKGVNVIQQLSDGSIYFPPGGGITTAGTGLNVTIQSDQMINQIHQIEDNLRKDIKNIKNKIETTTSGTVDTLEFGLDLKDDKIVVVERNTGAILGALF